MEKLASLLLIAAGIAGTIQLASGPRRRHDQAPIEALASQLEGAIGQAAETARARATALAARPRLAWVVATDEVTVRNLTPGELDLLPEPGERLQLAQVKLESRWNPLGVPEQGAGRALVLVREPAGMDLPIAAPAAATARAAPQLFIADRVAYLVAVASIQPRDRGDELRGVLTVARPVDLGPALRQVAALGIGARLDGGGRALGLGGVSRARPGWRAIEVPLRGAARAAGAKLVLSIPEAKPPWGRAGAAALLMFASVLGAGLFWTLGTARAAESRASRTSGAKGGFLV